MRCFVIFLAFIVAIVASVSAVDDTCFRPCGRIRDFVCGKYPDGTMETFENQCEMGIKACQKGVEIDKLYRGECGHPSEHQN